MTLKVRNRSTVRTLAVAALAAGFTLQTSGPGRADSPAGEDNSDVISLGFDAPSVDEIVRWQANELGISLAESQDIQQDFGRVFEFMLANGSNPSFGAIWVTYDPYTVHVRSTDALFEVTAVTDDSCVPISTQTETSESLQTETSDLTQTSAPATSPAAPDTETPTSSDVVPSTEPPPTTEVPASTDGLDSTSTAPASATTTVAADDPSTSVPDSANGFTGRVQVAGVPSTIAQTECGPESTTDSVATAEVRALDDATALLEDEIGMSIDRRSGGASFAELSAVVNAPDASRPQSGYRVSYSEGFVSVYGGGSGDFGGRIRTDFVRSVPDATPAGRDLAANGGDTVDVPVGGGQVAICTAGYMYAGSGVSGYVTSAHCNNGAAVLGGEFAASNGPALENCLHDHQAVNLDGAPTPIPMLGAQGSETHGYPIWYPTAGWVEGQVSTSLGRNGTQLGHVVDYDSALHESTGDCANEVRSGVRHDFTAVGGDSGGPILVEWNGQWYLLNIVSAGYANGDTLGTGGPYSPLPAGTSIVTP